MWEGTRETVKKKKKNITNVFHSTMNDSNAKSLGVLQLFLNKVRVLYMLSTSIVYFQSVDIDFNTRYCWSMQF